MLFDTQVGLRDGGAEDLEVTARKMGDSLAIILLTLEEQGHGDIINGLIKMRNIAFEESEAGLEEFLAKDSREELLRAVLGKFVEYGMVFASASIGRMKEEGQAKLRKARERN